MAANRSRLIYSTGPESARGTTKPEAAGDPRVSLEPSAHAIRVKRDRSGRRGKTVTTAGPFVLTRPDATQLLSELKRRLGCGGTLQRGDAERAGPFFELVIQGEQRDKVAEALAARGYPVKLAGG